MPKAFKVIPSLNNWEEVLYLTNPEEWSPHAVYQVCTPCFSSPGCCRIPSMLPGRGEGLVDRIPERLRRRGRCIPLSPWRHGALPAPISRRPW